MNRPAGRADQVPGARPVSLRADAQRNRERIVEAARQVFAEDGLDASLNEVARRAGVGVATLFRRFPTREDLIAATFAHPMAEYAALTETALADPDPWHGFCDYVRAVCAMQAGDRGFTDVLTQTFPTAKEFEAQRAEAFRRFTELIDRAKRGRRPTRRLRRRGPADAAHGQRRCRRRHRRRRPRDLAPAGRLPAPGLRRGRR